MASGDYILDRPIGDTGSIWLAVLSFFLPLLGLIAAQIYRSKNYIRNYKQCKKGAIIGLIFLGVVILIFLILLGLSLI